MVVYVGEWYEEIVKDVWIWWFDVDLCVISFLKVESGCIEFDESDNSFVFIV